MLKALQNGHELVAQKPTNGGYIVVAKTNGYHPFVTWWVDKEGHAYHGHYFSTKAEAVKDFEKRR